MWGVGRTENSYKNAIIKSNVENKQAKMQLCADIKWVFPVRTPIDQSEEPGRVFHVGTISCAPPVLKAKTFLSWTGGKTGR